MARVTIAEVKEILDTSLTDAQITAFITAANVLVTDVVGSSSLVSTALAKEIERFLTAHLITATMERQEIQSAVGPISVRYAELKEGLKATTYGQQVLMLDLSNGFARLGGKSVSLKAITSFE